MLQELVDNGWVIPTNRLAAIVNLSPRSLQGKKEYLYCGFRFSKSGKQGNVECRMSECRIKNARIEKFFT